jgi:hypothetical protein
MSELALLILVGGRQMPNFLTAQFLKPNVIVPIASHEAMKEGQAWSKIKPSLKTFCNNVNEPEVVDAFNLKEIRDVCLQSIDKFPNVEWVFNVTCATTVMSIAAYETAKEKGITVWYLDTDTKRVVALNGNPPDEDLFSVSVANYMKSNGREIFDCGNVNPSQELKDLAVAFAQDATRTTAFQQALAKTVGGQRVRESALLTVEIDVESIDIEELCNAALNAGLIEQFEKLADNKLHFQLLGKNYFDFLNGGWLELFAWTKAKETGRYNDDELCYSFTIPADGQQNQIDFAVTYSGALLIAECKTDAKPFKSTYLDKLNSVASLLGGNFVGRMFITNQIPDMTNSAVQDFFNQARARQIVIVTGDKLSDLGNILKKETGADGLRPTYFRG